MTALLTIVAKGDRTDFQLLSFSNEISGFKLCGCRTMVPRIILEPNQHIIYMTNGCMIGSVIALRLGGLHIFDQFSISVEVISK